jgi:hypothetical protein
MRLGSSCRMVFFDRTSGLSVGAWVTGGEKRPMGGQEKRLKGGHLSYKE